MKSLFISSLIFLSLATFASNHVLLLDASCKINCFTGTTVIPSEDQGYGTYENNYSNTFIDFVGLSREEIESKIENEFNGLCKNKFGQKASSNKSDCVYFKHSL